MSVRNRMIRSIAPALFAFLSLVLCAQDKKETADNAGPRTCASCHEQGATYIRSQDEWQVSAHSKTSPPVTCEKCHGGYPHDGKNAHNLKTDAESLCTSCHTQRAVLQGLGAKGIDEARCFHSAVDCIGCHMTERNHRMKVLRPDDPNVSETRIDTCTGCHKDNNRKARIEQIQEWQMTYKEEIEKVQKNVGAINAELKENPRRLTPNLKAKLDDLLFNIKLLERDGSHGFHNPDFTSAILSSALKDLAQIKSSMKIK